MLDISYEVFPPKTEKGAQSLFATIKAASRFSPKFVSVTYGAGGSSQNGTIDILRYVVGEGLYASGHLTCVGASKAQTDEVIDCYKKIGVRQIVALRGDMPNEEPFKPHSQGYSGSLELVKAIKEKGGFRVCVSAYPERHPQSLSFKSDLDMLKAKMDAGADYAITQFFFNTDLYFNLQERAQKAGITIPIIPGIIPTYNFESICRMAKKCHTFVPQSLSKRYNGKQDASDRMKIAQDFALEQLTELRQAGCKNFHIYSLNQQDFLIFLYESLQNL